MAEIMALDAKLLRHRVSRQQTSNHIKSVQYEHLHPKVQPGRITKPVKQSVRMPPRKRTRTSYFHSMLSSILPKDYTFFSCHHPLLSWEQPDERLLQDDPVDCYGTHAIEFCDEQHDFNITECERLIGKSIFEFSHHKVSPRGLRLLKRSQANLRAEIGADEYYRNKEVKRAEDALKHPCELLKDKSSNATTVITPVFASLPLQSQIEV